MNICTRTWKPTSSFLTRTHIPGFISLHMHMCMHTLQPVTINCQKGQEMCGIVITQDSLRFLLLPPGVSQCMCVCTYVHVHLFGIVCTIPMVRPGPSVAVHKCMHMHTHTRIDTESCECSVYTNMWLSTVVYMNRVWNNNPFCNMVHVCVCMWNSCSI